MKIQKNDAYTANKLLKQHKKGVRHKFIGCSIIFIFSLSQQWYYIKNHIRAELC